MALHKLYANPSYRARRASYVLRLGMGSAPLQPRPYRTKAAAIERARSEVDGFIARTAALRDAPALPGCSAQAAADHRRTCEAELADWRNLRADLYGAIAGAWPKWAGAGCRVASGRFYVEVRRLAPGEDGGLADSNIRGAA